MLPFSTAVGTCALEWDDAGITRVHFPHARLSHDRHADDPAAIPDHARAAAAAITRLLDGEPLDLSEIAISQAQVEPFAARVYAATRAVGPGETTTYGAIARELGDPSAARAVGASLGGNPTPIIVPCHRVLAADGSLHGFSAPGGIVTKRRLLEIELAPGFAQPALFV
jgi:methylated-DNA-[protein]-cysteine S-methyltransferase